MKNIRDALKNFDWLATGFAGIWLVFLIFLVAQLLGENQTSGAGKVAGILALILFCLIYLTSYGAHGLVPGRTTWQKTAIWCLILLIPSAVLGMLVGPWVLCLATYFVAMWAFQTPPKIGISVGLLMTALVTLTLLLVFPDTFFMGAYGFLLGSGFVLITATLSMSSEHRQAIHSRLQQAEYSEQVARDVHDILGHSLTVINLKAELAAALAHTQPARAANEMQQVADLSRTALAEVRATVTRMKLPDFAGEIQAASRALETAQIEAHLPGPEEAQVPGTNAALFSWVLRESVTNTVRHSKANNCWVRLEADRIEIIDDGKAQEITAGNGLSGLAKRVQDSGGDLVVESGSHTRILVTMNGDTSPLGERD